ncbi:hypothetical protein CC139_004495 [Salmonella enterica subsp. enterica serovar Glostrup]|nr:hypothetical protein [Salmonella enterica subsp. enterica serovar Glostrup]
MKHYLPLFAFLLISLDVLAGVEEATTTFNVKSRRPVCNIVYPAEVDLGTFVNTGSSGGGATLGAAEFSVSVSCDFQTTRPRIRFWDIGGSPEQNIGVVMSKLTGATGSQFIFLTDPDKNKSYCMNTTPNWSSSSGCLPFIVQDSASYTAKVRVDQQFSPDAVGDFEGRVGVEVYFP